MLRSIFDRFNIGRSTALYITRRVINAINELAPIVIKWSKGERASVGRMKLPVDSQKASMLLTHINIPAPKHNSEAR